MGDLKLVLKNNLIEIFILTYNRSRMLETAIRSVLNQTVKTKLTVVDNHSPDDTPQMIERLKSEGADFTYIRRAGMVALVRVLRQ